MKPKRLKLRLERPDLRLERPNLFYRTSPPSGSLPKKANNMSVSVRYRSNEKIVAKSMTNSMLAGYPSFIFQKWRKDEDMSMI